MRIKAFALGLLVGLTAAQVHASLPPLKIVQGFRNARNELVIQLEPDSTAPEQLASGNKILWGNSKTLHQLEVTSSDLRVSAEFVVSSKNRRENETGSLSWAEDGLNLECPSVQPSGDVVETYRKMPSSELKEIESRFKTGSIQIHWLPEIKDAEFLFRIEESQDLILVTAPRFNFHENYTVYRGIPGRLQMIPTLDAHESLSSREPGQISFTNGGGLHIPLAIELFKSTGRQRGYPSILETPNSPMKRLSVPRLTKSELRDLGFLKAIPIMLKTPCSPTVESESKHSRRSSHRTHTS